MPINVFANIPVAATAIQTVSFASLGLNSSNITVIHRIGTPPASWIPTRAINPISGFVNGDGYVILSKVDLDLTAYIVPPVPGSFGDMQNWVIANFSPLGHIHAIADVTGLQSALNSKQNVITTGTTSQYFKGDLSLGTFSNDVIAALPSQTGNIGKYLSTNGTTLTWNTIDLSAYTTGSGTSGYVSRWTGSNSLGIGVITDDGSNVGISTSPNSSWKLDVNGAIRGVMFESTSTVDNGTPYAAFRVNRTLSMSISANGHGFRDQTLFSRNAYSYASYDAAFTMNGSSHDHGVGFQSRIVSNGTGTTSNLWAVVDNNSQTLGLITNLTSFESEPTLNGGSGTSNRRGVWIKDVGGVSTLSANYGIFINNLTRGGSNYSIYSGTAPSYFAGRISVGNTSSASSIGGMFQTDNINNTSYRPAVFISATSATSNKPIVIRGEGQANMAFSAFSGNFQPALQIQSDDNNKVLYFFPSGSTNGAFIKAGASGLDIRVGGTTTDAGTLSTSFFTSGNVCIGSATDSGQKFQVVGSSYLNGTLNVIGATTFGSISGNNVQIGSGVLVSASSTGNYSTIAPTSLAFTQATGSYTGIMTYSTLSSSCSWTLPNASGTIMLENTVSGTFTTVDGKTITITNGRVTSIV